MTEFKSGNDSTLIASTNRTGGLSWRIAGWLTITYSVLALIAMVIFLGVYLTIEGHQTTGSTHVDWSLVSAQTTPSLWLSLAAPLWLPVAVFALTVPAAVVCFRQSRGRNGRALLCVYTLGMMLICIVLVGAAVHLSCLGHVRIETYFTMGTTTLLFTSQQVFYVSLFAAFLLVPVIAVLNAMRSTRDQRKRDTLQAHGE